MTTVRVWFTKTGEAAYISLLDLQRVMQRALKRARLPVWYTQGFNPHIYMTFAAPLALGQESLVESLDCKMEPLPENWQQACAALQACLPAGICAVKIEPAGMDPSEIASAVYEVRYPVQMRQDVLRAVQAYNTVPQALAEKKGKKGKIKQIDLKQYLPALEVQEKDGVFFGAAAGREHAYCEPCPAAGLFGKRGRPAIGRPAHSACGPENTEQ